MKEDFDRTASAIGPTRRDFIRSGLGVGVGYTLLSSVPSGAALSVLHQQPSREILDMTSFGARSGDASDTTPAVQSALQHRLRAGGRKIVFPTGTYDFWPDRAAEQYVYASNNDPGMKRIAFPLFDVANLEIDGQNSKFIFHHGINPFVLERSRNIIFANLSIDWKRPLHNEGKILGVSAEGIDLEISDQFPYKIANGFLYFLGEENAGCGIRDRDPCPIGGLLEFDTEKRETAYKVRDYYRTPYIQASALGPGKVRIVEPSFTATPGNTLVFGTTNRNYSAFTISDSSGIKLGNVTIHHCGGMGVIAQRSSDIELDHVRVTPSEGRMVSLPADATHFVNCSRRIVITNCLFENQLDDATNIHGIYIQISRLVSANTIEGRIVHPAQRGFDFVRPGHQLELVHSDSLLTYAQVVVRAAKRVNDQYLQVELVGTLPMECRVGDVFASTEGHPDVLVSKCTIQNNRARGLLLGSRGRIVVEDCSFHTPGAAVLMEGDARYWFEQAGVRDLLIRRNKFNACNFGVWGKATIEVGAGIDPTKRASSRYNRNIVIENNNFQMLDGSPALSVYSIDGLTIRNNRISRTLTSVVSQKPAELFEISDSVNVKIENNDIQ
jgi:hypothetical protein